MFSYFGRINKYELIVTLVITIVIDLDVFLKFSMVQLYIKFKTFIVKIFFNSSAEFYYHLYIRFCGDDFSESNSIDISFEMTRCYWIYLYNRDANIGSYKKSLCLLTFDFQTLFLSKSFQYHVSRTFF